MRVKWRYACVVLWLVAGCDDPDANSTAGDDAGVDAAPDTHDAGSDAETGSGSDAGQQPVTLAIPEGCNPLAFEHDCLFPFPSDTFTVADPDLPSGRRVVVGGAATVYRDDGVAVDFGGLHPADGFSHLPPIAVRLRGGVDPEGLVGPGDDFALAADPGSHTLLLDTVTGELLPHWAEVDLAAPSSDEQLLWIRSPVRLANDRRYVVALQGLQRPDGDPWGAPMGFAQLRDGLTIVGHEALSARFGPDVLEPLERAGIDRRDLVLAWDFTTESEQNVTRDMLAIRSAAIDWLAANAPSVEVVSVDEGAAVRDDLQADVARLVVGRIEVPLFVESDQVGALIHRGPDGTPTQNGTAWADFTATIPPSALGSDAPARVLQFGHGFFGGRDEILSGFNTSLANEMGALQIAVDWWGMMAADSGAVVGAIASDTSNLFAFTDRVHQAMVNQMALTEALHTTLLAQPAFSEASVPIYDPAQVYFFGISQGHILGGTFMALSPTIDRGVLSSGGAGFTFCMSRSRPFGPFLGFINVVSPDYLTPLRIVALSATSMDRIDPVTYAPHLVNDLIAPAPATRSVLMQHGLGDTSVPPLAQEIHARSAGIPALAEQARPIAVIESVSAPHTGSAMAQYDFGLLPEPALALGIAPADAPVHGALRTSRPARDQVDAFLRPGGLVEWFCAPLPCRID